MTRDKTTLIIPRETSTALEKQGGCKDSIDPKEVEVDEFDNYWSKKGRKKEDLKELNKTILDPSDPVNVTRWVSDPLKCDLASVDTPLRKHDTLVVYRGLAIPRGNHKLNNIGTHWSSNLNVARIFALNLNENYGYYHVDGLAYPSELKKLDKVIKGDKDIFPVILRAVASRKIIDSYSPESEFPFEYEVKIIESKIRSLGINSIGFLSGKDKRTVNWIPTTQSELRRKAIKQILRRKPTSSEFIGRIRKKGNNYHIPMTGQIVVKLRKKDAKSVRTSNT